jgi:hypothetical protein
MGRLHGKSNEVLGASHCDPAAAVMTPHKECRARASSRLDRRLSAGRVEETRNTLFLGELVVEVHSFFGLQDVRRDALVLEELQGFRADLQGLENAFGKHHHLGPVLQEFLDIGRLNPGTVVGAGLFPVPLAHPARPELRVPEGAPVFELDAKLLGAWALLRRWAALWRPRTVKFRGKTDGHLQ